MRMLGYMANSAEYNPSSTFAPNVGGEQYIAGCFRTNTAMSSIAANDYVIYARIGVD